MEIPCSGPPWSTFVPYSYWSGRYWICLSERGGCRFTLSHQLRSSACLLFFFLWTVYWQIDIGLDNLFPESAAFFFQRLFLSILMELWWGFKVQMVKNIFSFFCKWKWILQALDYKWPLEKSMKKSTTLRLVCSWYALIFVQASSFAWQRLFYFFCWSCCHGGSLLINLRISANLRVCLFFFFAASFIWQPYFWAHHRMQLFEWAGISLRRGSSTLFYCPSQALVLGKA